MRAKTDKKSDATAFNAKITVKTADRESAVAPVVAVLLILAVLMTIISLYSAIYVPALKEQSEIEHLAGVEDAFLKFSSDIESAILTKSEGTVTRNVELGGGSVVLSPLKSGGIMEVKNETPTWTYKIYKDGYDAQENLIAQSLLVNFSYESVGNFWMDNGYLWDYGIVSLKTPYSSVTPIQYTTYEAAADDIKANGGIFRSMFDLDYLSNVVFEKDGEGKLTGNTYLNCSEIIITAVTFEKGASDYTSGSGHATLKMDSKMEYQTISTGDLVITMNPDLFPPVNTDNLPNSAGDVLEYNIGKELDNLRNQGFANIGTFTYDPDHVFRVHFNAPVKVTVRNLILTISV